MPARDRHPLRAITYLAPGIPLAVFAYIAERFGAALGREVSLVSDDRLSGPMHGDHDPFAANPAEPPADVGFLCSPSYIYLTSLSVPSVELVPAGFVFADERNGGRAVYFSDVIVHADRDVRGLEDLAGGVFGFNDSCSLSGYFAARQEVARRAQTHAPSASPTTVPEPGFFAEERCTGSHEASIEAVLSGQVDVAAIDSNVLALVRRASPERLESLRVVESFGPHPIQPIVISTRASAEFGADLGERLAAVLLGLWDDPRTAAELARFGLSACVPIDADHYAEERAILAQLGVLPSRCG